MKRLCCVLAFFLAALLSIEAQRREKVERVPLSFRGDVCERVCSKHDGWERCEKEKRRNEWEVTCSDTRPSGGRGGKFDPRRP
ncbi:hypothetical protein RB195_002247 [Necator americanus]|uniref:Uncharacterized protein n=1 Tax=Necator americanus TaxID=51031 RepID=A0ABR1DIV1_NECAM